VTNTTRTRLTVTEFAAATGITVARANKLNQLAHRAANALARHDMAKWDWLVDLLESCAVCSGAQLQVSWPGVFPQFSCNGAHYYCPTK
jgi:hypothetical protein